LDDNPVVALLVGAFDAAKSDALKPKHHFNKGGRPAWWHVEITAD
jgi:hypothetical protein